VAAEESTFQETELRNITDRENRSRSWVQPDAERDEAPRKHSRQPVKRVEWHERHSRNSPRKEENPDQRCRQHGGHRQTANHSPFVRGTRKNREAVRGLCTKSKQAEFQTD
jgi:hypothetical protein